MFDEGEYGIFEKYSGSCFLGMWMGDVIVDLGFLILVNVGFRW